MFTAEAQKNAARNRENADPPPALNPLETEVIGLFVQLSRALGHSSGQLDKNQLELLAQPPAGAMVEAIVSAPEKERAERSRKERTNRLFQPKKRLS
jgi:hypothetical protein